MSRANQKPKFLTPSKEDLDRWINYENGTWTVRSWDSGRRYWVKVIEGQLECDCTNFSVVMAKHPQASCKHISDPKRGLLACLGALVIRGLDDRKKKPA